MRRIVELTAYISCHLDDSDIEFLTQEKIIPEKLPTPEELQDKKKNLLAELQALNLIEEEFKSISDGRSLAELQKD